jgi:trk system potassium uptake protein TrkA
MKVIVMGCGRVGAHLAGFLVDRGNQVTVVDRDPKAFLLLGGEFVESDEAGGPGAGSERILRTPSGIRCILGVGIDEEVLGAAGIEGAEALVAVTDNDYANIMASLMAKEIYQVPRVIARITDPQRERIFHETGIETICPTTLGARSIVEQLEVQPGGH